MKDNSGWGVFIIKHVIPLDDTYEHRESSDCWCNPKAEDEERLIIHNSLDKREKYEHLKVIK